MCGSSNSIPGMVLSSSPSRNGFKIQQVGWHVRHNGHRAVEALDGKRRISPYWGMPFFVRRMQAKTPLRALSEPSAFRSDARTTNSRCAQILDISQKLPLGTTRNPDASGSRCTRLPRRSVTTAGGLRLSLAGLACKVSFERRTEASRSSARSVARSSGFLQATNSLTLRCH